MRTSFLLVLLLCATPTAAQVRGIVVDETGLPLPGVLLELRDSDTLVETITSGSDGTFEIPASLRGDLVTARLDGFEPATVPRLEATRIVLRIGHASDTTDVIAPAITATTAPTAALLGSTLTASTVARMPSSRLKARESLPLLPAVVRGPDGLMQIGGARAHDAPLFLDGFNVTDPATGLSSINLPFETIQGVAVLRDPMAITYGGLLGGAVELQSRPGGDRFSAGVQGFVPRPRFSTPGFGRLEGIFPRVFAGGTSLGGRFRYNTAAEYDFERIPVPGVTKGSGPDIVEQSATIFARGDLQLSPADTIVVEALAFPSSTRSLGLSPLRDATAAPNLRGHDLFAGLTTRHVFASPSVLTIRVGVFGRRTTLRSPGDGPAALSPTGWRGNWFSSTERRASRETIQLTFERTLQTAHGSHEVTISGGAAFRRLDGSVLERPVLVDDGAGGVVRTIEFPAAAKPSADDRLIDSELRDVWTANDRFQIDGGVRVDSSNRHGTVPAARSGVRVVLDRSGATVLKAGVGRFVGVVPLAAQAFGGYPRRIDRLWEPRTASVVMERAYRPMADGLRLPTAVAATIEIDRQLFAGIDGQIGATARRTSRLASIDVPSAGGALSVRSEGISRYDELQISARKSWKHDQQVFVSYVRSSARGERNDFSVLFQELDRAVLHPRGVSRLASDVRNRWIAWGTVDAPSRIVISPVFEWHTGFPYSVLDPRQQYLGEPNSRQFPAFMTLDMVVYRTFTVRKRSADLGIQLFNATHHFNPRDVYAVATSPRFGTFANSVGTIVRGFMLIKW